MIKSIILLLSVLFSNISVAQEKNTLEEDLKKAIASENLTGAVWSTVSDDIVTIGAIGLKNAETNEIMSRPKIRLQINISFKRHIDARN
jgi:hypothetical protein